MGANALPPSRPPASRRVPGGQLRTKPKFLSHSLATNFSFPRPQAVLPSLSSAVA